MNRWLFNGLISSFLVPGRQKEPELCRYELVSLNFSNTRSCPSVSYLDKLLLMKQHYKTVDPQVRLF